MGRAQTSRRETEFAQSVRERLEVLAGNLPALEALLEEVRVAEDLDGPDELTPEQHRALGWLEGAAKAQDMTVLEFVDAWT